MANVDNKTTHGWPLPNKHNNITEDIGRIAESFNLADAAITAGGEDLSSLASRVSSVESGKANAGDITTLRNEYKAADASLTSSLTQNFQRADTGLANRIAAQEAKAELFSAMYLTDITGNPFSVDFHDASGINCTGELDTSAGVLRF